MAKKKESEIVKTLKTYRGVIKAVDVESHTVEVLVSTNSIDRHLEIVLPEAFKKRLKEYKDHPILLSSHDYWDLMKQIGEAVSVKITDEGLVAKFKYYVGKGNPEADWAFMLASEGVAAYSVGFIAHEWEDVQLSTEEWLARKKARRIYKDVELIEISQVLVPSNRDAVQECKEQAEHDAEEFNEAFEKMATDKKPVLTLIKDSEVYAELCVKALEKKGLIKDKQNVSRETVPVVKNMTPEEVKALIDSMLKSEEVKPVLLEAVRSSVEATIKASLNDTCKSLLALIKDDAELKDQLKFLLLEAVQEIANDNFYKELLFGKPVKDQKTSQETLTNAVREISQSLKF